MAGEDPAEYDRCFQELEENLFPKNAIEFCLVRQIADSEWRLRRIERLEAGLCTHHSTSTSRFARKHYPDTILPGRHGEKQLLGKSMEDHTQSLTNLARYRTMTSRDITRALRMIRQLRKDEFECKENRAANGAIHRPTRHRPGPLQHPRPAGTTTAALRAPGSSSADLQPDRLPRAGPVPANHRGPAVPNVGAQRAVPGSPAPRKTSQRAARISLLRSAASPPSPCPAPKRRSAANHDSRITNHE